MQIKSYRPVRSNWRSQTFYENGACAAIDIYKNLKYPVSILTKTGNFCPVGYADFYKTIGMVSHGGDDWVSFTGENIYHASEFDGWMKTEIDNAKGIGVWVVSNIPLLYCQDCKEKHFVKHQSWHCSQVMGYDGKKVKFGDLIAKAGSTGASSGPHVHDARKWCDDKGNTIHNNNGWNGAIPTDYPGFEFENTFVLEKVLNDAQWTLIGLLKSYIISLQKELYAKTH